MPIKNKEGTYEKIMEISKNNDYAAGSLLDYDFFSNHYQLIAIQWNLYKADTMGAKKNCPICRDVHFAVIISKIV